MQLPDVSRLLVAGALLLAGAGSVVPATVSAHTLAPRTADVTGQVVDPQFNPPAAPGEATSDDSAAATAGDEPVDFAPGETGTDRQEPPRSMGAE
jgi:hypothetical protein